MVSKKGEGKGKVIIISGPTATGKTDLAIKVAKLYNGEIINADALQVYKYMNIGTAKPTPQQILAVPYHLIDILTPDQPFDLYNFVQKARSLISQIIEKGKIPLVTGGTCLYIRGLIKGIAEGLPPPDPELRERLLRMEREKSNGYLHKLLLEVDPETGLRLHPNDLVRIVRALEVFYKTGKPMSIILKRHGFKEERYNYLWIVLDLDRKILKERIRKRTEAMIEKGFINEVQQLLDKGYNLSHKPLRALGYRHVIEYLEGKYKTIEELIEKITVDTYRFSKRQRRWLKGEGENLYWIDVGKDRFEEEVYSVVERFLEG